MGFQERANRRMEKQQGAIRRSEVFEMGGDDALIRRRVRSGLWVVRQPGVYSPGGVKPTWHSKLMAAVLASGAEAAASHRAAWVLWGLDGLDAAPIELNVPYVCSPIPDGAKRHRTRRAYAIEERQGIPVTGVERTLIDSGRYLHIDLIERGMEHALKVGLTDMAKLAEVLEREGGRGVPGAPKARLVFQRRSKGAAADSAAEVKLMQLLRKGGIPDPVRQFVVVKADGTKYVVDFAWPERHLLAEVDGLVKRWDSVALTNFLNRQNDLLAMGYHLRRFSWNAITKSPQSVLDQLRPFFL